MTLPLEDFLYGPLFRLRALSLDSLLPIILSSTLISSVHSVSLLAMLPSNSIPLNCSLTGIEEVGGSEHLEARLWKAKQKDPSSEGSAESAAGNRLKELCG